MNIEVTAEDIRNGKRRDCRRCPVALALTRAFGSPWSVMGMLARSHAEACLRVLPILAVLFQRDFDLGLEDLKPFAFELEELGGVP